MDYEKLAAAIKLCGSTPKVDQCPQCPYWASGDMNNCIPRVTADAATAITDLLARAEAAEKIVDEYAESARAIALWLSAFCDRTLSYPSMISNAARKISLVYAEVEARAEKAERERDAAIHDVFEAASAKCFWCKHQDHKWLSDGKMDDLCFTCLKNNKCNWEWNGGQKEE